MRPLDIDTSAIKICPSQGEARRHTIEEGFFTPLRRRDLWSPRSSRLYRSSKSQGQVDRLLGVDLLQGYRYDQNVKYF